MDVITAFLNGSISEEILMEIPDGFPGVSDPMLACRINRALYRLKQSPKASYDQINTWLHDQGLKRSECDPNLYYLRQNSKLTILLLYVDDLLITGDDAQAIINLKEKLQHKFSMTDLGEAQNYLGVEIHRQQNGIFLSQQAYIRKLLDKFQMRGCNSTRLSIDPKMQLSRSMGTLKTNPG